MKKVTVWTDWGGRCDQSIHLNVIDVTITERGHLKLRCQGYELMVYSSYVGYRVEEYTDDAV